MANFCLPKFAADAFKDKLRSGEINPSQLADMTSQERNEFFKGFLGEANAKETNALFESKLLLKDQQAGIIRWAKSVSGLTPEAQRELITRVQKMEKLLNPEEEKAFLADLAEKKLGIGVSMEEAQKISELAKAAEDAKGGTDRMVYGRAKVAFSNYVSDLKRDANKLRILDFKTDPLGSAGKAISNLGGQTKSITASFDNSAIFNQGWKPMFTNPLIWGKNATKTYGDFAKTIGGKNIMNEVNADIVSRPTYDMMKRAKLSVGTAEEAFPTALPEKIPVLGRLYQASQDAYTAFVHRTRADIFDKMIQVAQKGGKDLDRKELESIGAMVNSLTGRGGFGKFEGPIVDSANNLLFSPRFFKSQIDVLTQPLTGAGGSNFVRVQAAQNLIKILAGTAAVMGAVQGVGKLYGMEDMVEWDPRSSDVGKIKVGNTRYGIGGGLAGVLTLLSRIVPTQHNGEWGFYKKSSTTGKVTKTNDPKAYKGDTVGDVITDFFGNKLSPAAQLVDDWYISGVDFDGEKPTVMKSALKLITPFGVSTYLDLAKDPEAEKLFTLILAGHGINVSNY